LSTFPNYIYNTIKTEKKYRFQFHIHENKGNKKKKKITLFFILARKEKKKKKLM